MVVRGPAQVIFHREVPLNLRSKRLVVSYSDGEGTDAGVGVAIWAPDLAQPLAAFICIPREVRLYWSAQRTSPAKHDIFQIEAIGPLVTLATWPRIMQDRLWIHFIDNSAAQSALVKGSSSVMSGDLIIGQTWETIARRRLLPWFDRVDSGSNPVDGLSRGKWDGSWREVAEGRLPAQLLHALRRWHFG